MARYFLDTNICIYAWQKQHPQVLARMAELRSVLPDVNTRVLQAERSVEEIFDRAYRMLRLRKVVVCLLGLGKPAI